MSELDHAGSSLEEPANAEVDFIVVGGTPAVLLGDPAVTFDVDILHGRCGSPPSLRVQIGSDVFDGSVQARLAELEAGF